MSGAERDLTPLAPIGMGRTRSGPVREQRPIYVDLLPPCNHACPAGENIQEWLRLVKANRDEDAWRELTRNNPFPAIHGRVCYHPCETACNRVELDGAVSVHAVERYLGDLAIERGWRFHRSRPATGRRLLVVGAGPAGLSAAYQLAVLGHHVEVRDASPHPGGMMRYGIPQYRLPRDVLDAEVERVADLGVRTSPTTGSPTSSRSRPRAGSTRFSWRSARICPSGWTSPPGTPHGSSKR